MKLFGNTRYQANFYTLVDTCQGSKSQLLHIKKSHVKAIDQPSQRCNAESTNIHTSACVANFIEKLIGCNPQVYGSRYSKGPPCRTKSQLFALAETMHNLSMSNDNDVYVLSGCLPSCERDVYAIIAEPMTCYYRPHLMEYILKLRITDRSYEERKQYIIYDSDSFVADVGGYLGLLLGYSILSLYNEMEALIKRVIQRTQRSFLSFKINNKQ